MITGDTKISIKDVTDWNLHWLCVEIEYNVLNKDLSLEQTVDACASIEGRRDTVLYQWDTIYDHPTGLREELQKLPNWSKLKDLLQQARQQAYNRSSKQHRDMLHQKLGITGEA